MLGALVTFAVLAPALAGGVALWLSANAREAAAVTLAADLFAVVVWLALLGVPPQVATAWQWAPELGMAVSWRIDAATLAFALLVNGVGAVVQQYAAAYFAGSAKAPRVLGGLALFQSAMAGLVLADDLLLLYVFWELTALCSFALILADADERDDAFGSALQALLVTMGGGLCLLVAVLVLGHAGQTTSLSELLQTPLPQGTRNLALALILVAAFTKSAQFPFHRWLPAAMVAPTPVSALLHSATMVKAGIILLIYVQPLFSDLSLWGALVPVGALTSILGSWRALGSSDLKLLLAWSTVSQLGLLVLVLGIGSDAALAACVLHLFAHAFFKGGLFLTVGAVDHGAGSRELDRLGGLWRRMPLSFVAMLLLAASMAGLPLTFGFHTKELALEELLGSRGWIPVSATVGALVGAVGTAAYSFRTALDPFLGPRRTEEGAHDAGAALLMGPLLLGGLGVLVGLMPSPLVSGLFAPVTGALLGEPADVHAAVFPEASVTLFTGLAVVLAGAVVWALLRGRRLPDSSFELFQPGLAALGRAGARADLFLAGLRPSTYFGLIVVFGFVPAAWLVPEALDGLVIDLAEPTLWLVVLQTAVLLTMLRVEGHLSTVLLVTVVGFSVALMFRAAQAPDLALTQLLVDMLTSVLLVLAIRLLDRRAPPEGGRDREPGAALVGIACGIGAFAIMQVQLAEPTPPQVSDYYLGQGAEFAEGENVVNLILTDLRALDTLGETLVIAVAAVGIAGIMRGREMPFTQSGGIAERRA